VLKVLFAVIHLYYLFVVEREFSEAYAEVVLVAGAVSSQL
jgi:Na+/glutamate symporter